MAEKNDLYYIRQVLRGEVDAFAHIVRQYNRMVFTVVNRVVQRREEAEDITQEIFVKVFQTLDKFREESEFSTWLYRVAYNTAISELRRRKNLRLAYEENYDNIPDENILDVVDDLSIEQQLVYLDDILDKMPSDDALLITMFYLNGHSVKEIGEIVGQSVGNIKVRLHRIRKYMSCEMNKLIR